MDATLNQFENLSAESANDRMAQMTSEERTEYNNYLDEQRALGNDMSEFDGEVTEDEPKGSHDLSDDAQALASAGHGTDEDYGGGCHIEDFMGE